MCQLWHLIIMLLFLGILHILGLRIAYVPLLGLGVDLHVYFYFIFFRMILHKSDCTNSYTFVTNSLKRKIVTFSHTSELVTRP